jgi:hypothetical protein
VAGEVGSMVAIIEGALGRRSLMTQEELDRYSQYIDRDRLVYIGHQQALFDEARAALFEQYPNEYVAVVVEGCAIL